MKKYIRSITVIVFILSIFLLTNCKTIYASTANIEIPAKNVENGQEVTVDINVTSDVNIGTFDLRMTYDASLLEYVSGADNGGSGVLQVLNSELNQTNTVSKQLVFKALKEGSTDFTVQLASSNVLDMSAVAMELTGGIGTITVGGNSGPSSDNNLTSLMITAIDNDGNASELTYEPTFSPDITEYKANVGSSIKKLSVAAAVSNQQATTKVSGAKLNIGDNLTTVVVTAADGQKKTYNIYTTKEANAEDSASVESDLKPVPENLSPVFAGKIGKYIIQQFDGMSYPSGFSKFGLDYDTTTVAALSGFDGDVVLMCLADDESGANAALFVYNQSKDSFSLYNSSESVNNYIMLTLEDGVSAPDGFTETTVQINGIDTVAWNGQDINVDAGKYLVYAIDSMGKKGFYVYDSEEICFSAYNISNNAVSQKQETPELQGKYDELKKKVEDDNIIKIEIVIGFLVLCFVLIIYISVLLLKIKKLSNEDEIVENNTDANIVYPASAPQKELKLDLAIKANEVKRENIANDVKDMLDESKETESIKEHNSEKNKTQNPEHVSNANNLNFSITNVENKLDNQSKKSLDDTSTDLGIVFVDIENEDKK